MREGARLRAAIVFLTRLPMPGTGLRAEDFAAALRYYPLVGLLVGALGALGFVLGHRIGGPPVGALVALAATLLITGAFHEDGLADVFDGLGGATRERMMAIMRDSRLGTFGVAALFVTLALKVVALAAMPPALALLALLVAHTLSRLSAVLVMATSRYARAEGTASASAQGTAPANVAIAALTGAVVWGGFAFLLGTAPALAALTGTALGHGAARLLFERRLGGYTGDGLGAVQQLSELGLYLGLLAWL